MDSHSSNTVNKIATGLLNTSFKPKTVALLTASCEDAKTKLYEYFVPMTDKIVKLGSEPVGTQIGDTVTQIGDTVPRTLVLLDCAYSLSSAVLAGGLVARQENCTVVVLALADTDHVPFTAKRADYWLHMDNTGLSVKKNRHQYR